MRNLFRLIAVCLLFFSPGTAWAQRDFSQAKIKAEQVRGNIYMLTGPGGNIGASVGEDGTLIIDDKFAPLADKIRAALKSVGGGELKFILNTHWHADHTGANPVFGPEATILAHTNVRKRLTGELKRAGNPGQPAPKEGWPVITFDQSLSIHFNGEEINVIHFPHGHTDGDSVIFFTKSNVVHMGDDFFAGRFPFVDLGSGGDVAGLVKNISAVIKKLPADVKIIPGHGPLSTLDDLKKYQRMIKETTEAVRRQMQAAKSLDEIKAAGLASEWKSWGAGFINEERWIETIYHSYSR